MIIDTLIICICTYLYSAVISLSLITLGIAVKIIIEVFKGDFQDER